MRNLRNLLIVALASSCCVASAQVIVNQGTNPPAPRPAPPVNSHPAYPGGASYHAPVTQSGGSSAGVTYHGYQGSSSNARYISSEPTTSGSQVFGSHSLQPASLNGRSENWFPGSHPSPAPGGEQDTHGSFGWHDGAIRESRLPGEGLPDNRDNRFDRRPQSPESSWHESEIRHDWRSPEPSWHEASRWGGDERNEFYRHAEWGRADRWAHDFGNRFADKGKEYFGGLAKWAGSFSATGSTTEQTAVANSSKNWYNGGMITAAQPSASVNPWITYWAYIPTIGWLRERAAYFEDRFWDWSWW